MNNISTLGIDLAKNVFQLHGTDSKGKAVLNNELHEHFSLWYLGFNSGKQSNSPIKEMKK